MISRYFRNRKCLLQMAGLEMPLQWQTGKAPVSPLYVRYGRGGLRAVYEKPQPGTWKNFTAYPNRLISLFVFLCVFLYSL